MVLVVEVMGQRTQGGSGKLRATAAASMKAAGSKASADESCGPWDLTQQTIATGG